MRLTFCLLDKTYHHFAILYYSTFMSDFVISANLENRVL